ncbi:Nnf1 [Moelleriella libera RCEF 2490]|uniref:Nnf1 n=1 Tax=Moelleriella libera RCEF 2490 TaxID=1081109 RepID=A0A167YVZ3_9HYPO|nr:Nnf1 [Moelleriella libera RCEF 2490]
MASEAPIPPAAVVGVAPGPRASRLQEIFGSCLERTLAKLSYDKVAGCFPTMARRAEPVLRQVQSQMVAKLHDKSTREFAAILQARDVVAKLNALEGLVARAQAEREKLEQQQQQRKGEEEEEQQPDGEGAERGNGNENGNGNGTGAGKAGVPTPPHLLSPQDILNAHLGAHLVAHRESLTARFETTQAQNALLAEHVRQQRAEVQQLLDQLDAAVGDVRAANAVLGPVVEELAGEARVVDGELKALE